MRKLALITLALLLVFLVFVGCQPNENSSAEPEGNLDHELSTNNIIMSISIKKSTGTDVVVYDDTETLEQFQTIFAQASKQAGIVDMVDPEYELTIVYDQNKQQSLYLWIGEAGQRSTFMKSEDTHFIYAVPAEMTDKLIELVEVPLN